MASPYRPRTSLRARPERLDGTRRGKASLRRTDTYGQSSHGTSAFWLLATNLLDAQDVAPVRRLHVHHIAGTVTQQGPPHVTIDCPRPAWTIAYG